MVDRAQLFPVADRARRDVRRLRLRGYWIDIGTPEKYMQVHRDIMDGRYSARAPFAGDAGSGVGVARRARRGGRRAVEGPCFIDEGAVVKAGARIVPYRVDRPPDATSRSGAIVDGAIIWPNTLDQPGSDRPRLDPRPPLPHRPQRRRSNAGVVLGDKTGRHRLQPALTATSMTINPDIFKAYDVRGALPAARSTRRRRARSAAASSPI